MFGSTLDLGVWVKNLTDEEYYTSFPVGGTFGVRIATIGAPRTAGPYRELRLLTHDKLCKVKSGTA